MEDPLQQRQRKIIHIDMDAFYAAVEQRDNPSYRGKPVVVGGLPEGRGGVVATASYEARVYGVRSAMPSKKAQQLCPQAIFLRPRFEAYKAASQKIREIFYRYTDKVEPLSLDEAYLDVTDDKQGIGSALDIAAAIKKAVREELQLTASAGVSVNKFLAKIASDLQKPDGLTFIGPSRIEAFMEGLKVEKFFGVGKVTAERMKQLGLHTGADVKQLSEATLVAHFGKAGHFFYNIVRGIDHREVQPNRETKSVGAEDTFVEDLTTFDAMREELEQLAITVAGRLQHHTLKGKTVTLKIRYADFRSITRSQSFTCAIADKENILAAAITLLAATEPEGKPVRLLGITLSNFGVSDSKSKNDTDNHQLSLF